MKPKKSKTKSSDKTPNLKNLTISYFKLIVYHIMRFVNETYLQATDADIKIIKNFTILIFVKIFAILFLFGSVK